MEVIDLHCHLDLYNDPARIIKGCQERGTYVLSVTTVPSAFLVTESLAAGGTRIRTALGLHPELAVQRSHELPLFEKLLPRARYVGEVGLDGSPPHRRSIEQQREVLREVLRLCANAGGRVITLHSRGAVDELLDVLEEEPSAGTFMLHWFVGSARAVRRASEMGCWFTIGPMMFASARGRDAVASMPSDRLLPESDGPFGQIADRPIFPWEAWRVVPLLAELWCKPRRQVEAQMRDSLTRLAVAAAPK